MKEPPFKMDDWWPSYWAKSVRYKGRLIRYYQTIVPGVCEATIWQMTERGWTMFNVEAPTLDVVLAAAKCSINAFNSRKI